jgi:DNA polymerase IV
MPSRDSIASLLSTHLNTIIHRSFLHSAALSSYRRPEEDILGETERSSESRQNKAKRIPSDKAHLSMSRLILHIDFNSFFASVEAQANPFLRGKAFAVAGKGKGRIDRRAGIDEGSRTNIHDLTHTRSVVTTASREAKLLGIKTAMGTWEALRIIPNLPILPGDPRKYADITNRFLTILHEYCDTVEQFSTDEAFADITTAAQDKFGAIVLAQIIRAAINERIGESCTASIGIGPNKLIAKLASESVKPNGITYIDPADAECFVASRPIGDICGIGRRLQKRLEAIGVISIRSLRLIDRSRLEKEFGPHCASFLWNAARDIGDDHIDPDTEDPKSIGHSYTFPHDLLTINEIHDNLLALSDMVAQRLRNQRLACTAVHSYVRYADGGGNGIHVSFREPIANGLALFRLVYRSFQKVIDLDRGIRLLGISANGLTSHIPSSLFIQDQKQQLALSAIDRLTQKFGSGVCSRASTLNTSFLERVSGWHYDVPFHSPSISQSPPPYAMQAPMSHDKRQQSLANGFPQR